MVSLAEIKPADVLIYLRKSRTDDPSLSVAEVLSLKRSRSSLRPLTRSLRRLTLPTVLRVRKRPRRRCTLRWGP